MEVIVVGGGFVGLATAISLAERKHAVQLVEIDPTRRALIEVGTPPFHEPGMADALRASLSRGDVRVRPDLASTTPADLVILCVATPSLPDGSADCSQVRAAAAETARTANRWDRPVTLVVKSTAPPGTTRSLRPILDREGGAAAASRLAMNPEFLREGSALLDARAPDRIVVGTDSPDAERALRDLYAADTCPVVATDLETAETIKYASNALLATKVAFANELANLCEPIGVNVDAVMHAVGLDKRIGPHFLQAGPGFGGSCFPKDLAALAALGRQHGVALRIVESVLRGNEAQPRRLVELAERVAGPLAGRRVAVLGLAFKPRTSDVRETPALPVWRELVARGASVTGFDPEAGPSFAALVPGAEIAPTLEAALRGADLAVLVTDWPDFRRLDGKTLRGLMRRPALVDGRRMLDATQLASVGVTYVALGDGRTTEGKR